MEDSLGYTYSPYFSPSCYAHAQTPPVIPDASLCPLSPYLNFAPLPVTLHYHSSSLPPSYTIETPWNNKYHCSHPSRDCVNSFTSVPQWIHVPPIGPARSHSQSFGGSSYPYSYYSTTGERPPPLITAPIPPGSPVPTHPPPFYIHPLLNGEIPRSGFIFNLPSRNFSPVRFIGLGQTSLLSHEELSQPATHPAISHIVISCDAIPQWPIQIIYDPEPNTIRVPPGHPPPAITLGDVLIAIHRSLHTRITHADWAQLNTSDEIAVARAYTKRCNSSPHTEDLQRTQGVKRVDFLLERVWFKGLLRDGDRWDRMKMVIR